MSKKALAYLAAGVIAIGGGAAAVATAVGGDDGGPTHTMQNGQTMSGSHMMSDGSSMDRDMSSMHDSDK